MPQKNPAAVASGDQNLHIEPVGGDEPLLLQQMAEGSMDAFERLYRRLYPKVYRYLEPFCFGNGVEPFDIAQDIFEKIWHKRAALTGIISLEFYLYQMARNRLIDLRRSLNVKEEHLRNLAQNAPNGFNNTGFEVEYREFNRKALEAIAKLPARRQLIFSMNINEDLSAAEIADKLDISLSVVRKQLYLASQSIRSILKEPDTLSAILLTLIAILMQ